MRRPVTIAFIITGSLLSINSCKHEPVYPKTPAKDTTATPGDDNEELCDPNVVYFQNEVLPIFASNCAMSGCHDASSAQDGIVLSSYNSVMSSGVIEPGNAGGSDLIDAITETDPDKHMPPPPNTPLTSTQITLISNWINQGANNTVCNAAECDTSNVTYSGSIKTLIQNKCLGCHSGGAPSGGYNFSTHAGVVAAKTRLFGAVSHHTGYSAMPKNGNKLPLCDIRKIKTWLDAGAPEN